jgi:hypothetical protein
LEAACNVPWNRGHRLKTHTAVSQAYTKSAASQLSGRISSFQRTFIGREKKDAAGGESKRTRGATGRHLVTTVPSYRGNMRTMKEVTRTQTGVRLESRLLKVLKALATELEMPLGDLLEGIVLHAFEGKAPFSAPTLKKIKALKSVYGLDLTAEDSHSLREAQTQ